MADDDAPFPSFRLTAVDLVDATLSPPGVTLSLGPVPSGQKWRVEHLETSLTYGVARSILVLVGDDVDTARLYDEVDQGPFNYSQPLTVGSGESLLVQFVGTPRNGRLGKCFATATMQYLVV